VTAETWRVRHPDGSTDAVTVTKLDDGRWRAETPSGRSWSVRPSPRAAVTALFDDSSGTVFGPGETPEERAAFARGVEAMRAAAVAVCLAEGDASVADAEKATEYEGVSNARWSAATSLMLSQNIEAIVIEQEKAK
jgi:hypothetical protein